MKQVLSTGLTDGCTFQGRWQPKTTVNSKDNGKDPSINAIALLLNL